MLIKFQQMNKIERELAFPFFTWEAWHQRVICLMSLAPTRTRWLSSYRQGELQGCLATRSLSREECCCSTMLRWKYRQDRGLATEKQYLSCLGQISWVLATWSGEGNGTPLQYSCLENPMDGEAWWAWLKQLKSWAWLKQLSSSSHLKIRFYRVSLFSI